MVVRRGIGIALSSGQRVGKTCKPPVLKLQSPMTSKSYGRFSPTPCSRAAPPIHARAPPFSFLFLHSPSESDYPGTGASLPPTKASGAMAGTASSGGGHRERRWRSRRRAPRAAAAERTEGSTAAAGTSASLRRPRIRGGSGSRAPDPCPPALGPRRGGGGVGRRRRRPPPRQI